MSSDTHRHTIHHTHTHTESASLHTFNMYADELEFMRQRKTAVCNIKIKCVY